MDNDKKGKKEEEKKIFDKKTQDPEQIKENLDKANKQNIIAGKIKNFFIKLKNFIGIGLAEAKSIFMDLKKIDVKKMDPRKFDIKKINLKGMKVNRRKMWVSAIIVCIIFMLFQGVMNIKNVLFPDKKKAAEETALEETVPVKVYKVKRIDFKDTLPVLGTIKGYKEINLKFQISGMLESFNFEAGEAIQEGDIIANLEQKEALLKLKYAEIGYNTAKKMFGAGGINEDAVEKSKLEYESAKSELEKTNIYAISDGFMGMQELDVGSYVTPNDRVGIFVDINKVYAEFEIIEKDVPKLKIGQKTDVFVDALPNKNFVGTLDVLSPIIEGRTRTQKIKIELKNDEHLIKPGMFTRGLISTYEKKNAVIIPASSLKKQEDKYVVFIVIKEEKPEASPEAQANKPENDGKNKKDKKDKADKEESKEEIAKSPEKELGNIEVRPVVVSYMTQDSVEIEKGVDEGEMVVMELYQELKDKQKVEVAEVQEMLY